MSETLPAPLRTIAQELELREVEHRRGIAFRNTSQNRDYYAPDYGFIVSPDELRYLVLFGSRLVSAEASQTYDDKMLLLYIDESIAEAERFLNIDLTPRWVRHDDPIMTSGDGSVIERTAEDMKIPQAVLDMDEIHRAKLIVRECAYNYRYRVDNNWLYQKLRRRPLVGIDKAVIIDPYFNTIINLMPMRKESKGFPSSVKFIPQLMNFGSFVSVAANGQGMRFPYDNSPCIFIDYRTGFSKSELVPAELRKLVRMLAGIMLLADLGKGKNPGIASASASLNSISQSYSTTQSASYGFFGAEIEYYKWHIKKILDQMPKYSSPLIGVI